MEEEKAGHISECLFPCAFYQVDEILPESGAQCQENQQAACERRQAEAVLEERSFFRNSGGRRLKGEMGLRAERSYVYQRYIWHVICSVT